VSYSVTPNKVKNVISEVLASVPEVQKDPSPVVRIVNYAEFTVRYEIRYTISDFSRHVDIEAEIMNLLWYRFKRYGIDIPMPVRDINLRQVTPESLQDGQERRAEEILSRMEKVEILTTLSRDELRKLAGQVRVETYAAGELPVKQGDPGDSFYMIKSGKVDVIVEKAGGESAVVATLGPGNFFGEMSLLTGAVRTASILVKEDAEFIVVDKDSFASTLANHPSLVESLSHILAARQAGLDAQRERLDADALEHRKQVAKGDMLSKIRDFFGLR
jgi:CRP-like cAMP-binding protein